jgi:hypothetical protein
VQITAGTFSDPTMRPHLQAYYDKQKEDVIAAWKAREPLPDEVSFRLPDGTTALGKPISAEQMEKALVPFDKWLEFQADRFTNPVFGPKRLEMAQKQLDMLKANGPDTSSNVRMTFSSNGVLLAAINTDGTTMTSNGSGQYLDKIIEKANDLGLSGQNRLDYLNREFSAALSAHHDDLDVTRYTDATIPTRRQYGQLWHQNFDIDAHYSSALVEAQASYDDAFAWHQQSQAYLDQMRDFLLKMQEA